MFKKIYILLKLINHKNTGSEYTLQHPYPGQLGPKLIYLPLSKIPTKPSQNLSKINPSKNRVDAFSDFDLC